MTALERLKPVSVPWMISPSVPYLSLVEVAGKPVAATFIAFFKCEPEAVPASSGVTVIHAPPAFVLSETAKGAAYRLVKVSFIDGLFGRQCDAFADHMVIPEEDYDWSLVPGRMRDGEAPDVTVARAHRLWLDSGVCPHPRMYEVQGSRWLSELRLDPDQWRHYILLGHDEYLDVIARGWSWQPGQVVD